MNLGAYNSKLTYTVVIFAIFYLILTLTFSSYSNIIVYMHQKYHHHGYGQIFLSANVIAFMLTCFFSPTILTLTKATTRNVLILASCAFTINYLYPAIKTNHQTDQNGEIPPPSSLQTFIQIFASIIGGAGASFIVIVQGRYLNSLLKNIDDKGKYFGLYSFIKITRTLLGAILILAALGYGNSQIYFLVLILLCLLAVIYAFFMIPNTVPQLQDNQGDQNGSTSIKENLCRVFRYYKIMAPIIPLLIILGITNGFISSSLAHFLPPSSSEAESDRSIGIALIFHGFGMCMGGPLAGYIRDKYGVIRCSKFNIICFEIAFILIIVFLWLGKHTLSAWMVAMMIGTLSSSLICNMIMICTQVYEGKMESFAIFNQMNTLFFCGYQLLVSTLNNMCNMQDYMAYEAMLFIIIGFVALILLHKYVKVHREDEDREPSETEIA